MADEELDKPIRVELLPYDEKAADAALDALYDLFLSAKRNRARRRAAVGEIVDSSKKSLTVGRGVVE